MSSVSGLSPAHRAEVRKLIIDGANLLLRNIADVHYSQDARKRWSGIAERRLIRNGDIVHHSDCSSLATWLLWNGLHHRFGVRDVVNGQDWNAGFTGTMLRHGKLVHSEANIKVGDLALYGARPNGEHVAVCVGGGMVFSHGSEAGPFKLKLRYRPDLLEIRRYI